MCGRDVLDVDVDTIVAAFALDRAPTSIEPRYNISPGYGGVGTPWIVRVAADQQRELITARWWLIPRFWKKPLQQLPSTFNARAEDIAHKPMFRDSLVKRRCLVPASGWYEFRGPRGKKESFLFRIPSLPVFGFAGIYDEWTSPDGEVITSFAIVTTEPNETARAIHDRMPVVLHPGDHATWLDPANHDPARLQALLRPWDGDTTVYRTSGFGNDPRREGRECIEAFREHDKKRDDGPLFEC
jgi:putative SOS response-associated peptidase YedK